MMYLDLADIFSPPKPPRTMKYRKPQLWSVAPMLCFQSMEKSKPIWIYGNLAVELFELLRFQHEDLKYGKSKKFYYVQEGTYRSWKFQKYTGAENEWWFVHDWFSFKFSQEYYELLLEYLREFFPPWDVDPFTFSHVSILFNLISSFLDKSGIIK